MLQSLLKEKKFVIFFFFLILLIKSLSIKMLKFIFIIYYQLLF